MQLFFFCLEVLIQENCIWSEMMKKYLFSNCVKNLQSFS